jgi:hypothetical protein
MIMCCCCLTLLNTCLINNMRVLKNSVFTMDYTIFSSLEVRSFSLEVRCFFP